MEEKKKLFSTPQIFETTMQCYKDFLAVIYNFVINTERIRVWETAPPKANASG
jgi:hypothetical protein